MDSPVPISIPRSALTQKKSSNSFLILGAVIIVIAGIVSGYFLSKTSKPQVEGKSTASKDIVNSANIVGSNDTKTFSDVATGKLDKGGIKGEGTHHLTRPGGDSQTVYLVSSIVDLDQFVGKQVEINGQTLKGRYASWLMDVGRVKILE